MNYTLLGHLCDGWQIQEGVCINWWAVFTVIWWVYLVSEMSGHVFPLEYDVTAASQHGANHAAGWCDQTTYKSPMSARTLATLSIEHVQGDITSVRIGHLQLYCGGGDKGYTSSSVLCSPLLCLGLTLVVPVCFQVVTWVTASITSLSDQGYKLEGSSPLNILLFTSSWNVIWYVMKHDTVKIFCLS